jgi:hypothetical protein
MTNEKTKTEKHPMLHYFDWCGEGTATINGYEIRIHHDPYAMNPRGYMGGYSYDSTLIFFSNNTGSHGCWLSDEKVAHEARTCSLVDYIETLTDYSIMEEDDHMGQEMPDKWHELRISNRLHANHAVIGLKYYDHGCNGVTIHSDGIYDVKFDPHHKDAVDGLMHIPINGGGTPSQYEVEDKIKRMEAELMEYNAYLSGDVWGYEVLRDGEYVDSFWGFYGDHEDSGLFDEIQFTVEPMTEGE